ncbi:MAG: helix-turn-helix transcriptional regulator, partial [Lachnospiraceae bacterium]|nr:helix-turn-helix transcriptional regulator [Lachnospiraceae bacterium]
MSFGQNLQFLRKMGNKMTQEELAEKLGVSRQTVSKWELDAVYPEMDKIIELCNLFSCTMDGLVREDMNIPDEAYSDICFKDIEAFSYASYAVISREPEEDAIRHAGQWAEKLGISQPVIIGWDFPVVSQEQINVYNMHGYAAALILDEEILKNNAASEEFEVTRQEKQKYTNSTLNQEENMLKCKY